MADPKKYDLNDIARDAVYEATRSMPESTTAEVEAKRKAKADIESVLKPALTESFKNEGASDLGILQADVNKVAELILAKQNTHAAAFTTWNGLLDDISNSTPAERGTATAYLNRRMLEKAQTNYITALTAAEKAAGSLDSAFKTDFTTAYNAALAATTSDSQKISINIQLAKKLDTYAKDVGAYSGQYDAAMGGVASAIIAKLKTALTERNKVVQADKTTTKATDVEKKAADDAEKEVRDAYNDAVNNTFKHEVGHEGRDKAFKYVLQVAVEAAAKADADIRRDVSQLKAEKVSPKLDAVWDMLGKDRLTAYANVNPATGQDAGKGGAKGEGMSAETKARIAGVTLLVGAAASGFGFRKTDEETGQKKMTAFSWVAMTALGVAGAALLMKPDLMHMAGQKMGMGRG